MARTPIIGPAMTAEACVCMSVKSMSIRSNDDSLESDFPAKPTGTRAGLGCRTGAWFLHELLEMLSPTIFFAVGFMKQKGSN